MALLDTVKQHVVEFTDGESPAINFDKLTLVGVRVPDNFQVAEIKLLAGTSMEDEEFVSVYDETGAAVSIPVSATSAGHYDITAFNLRSLQYVKLKVEVPEPAEPEEGEAPEEVVIPPVTVFLAHVK